MGWESIAESLLQDVRYGIRLLTRNLGFTIAAVLALALGIGVNTAVFTAYKSMVARPLDARSARDMVNIGLTRTSSGAGFTFSYPDYEEIRDTGRAFTGVLAFTPDRFALSSAGDLVSQRTSAATSQLGRLGLLSPGASNTEFASTFVVSENYFQVLGVQALRGRTFESLTTSELAASPSVLISENYWQKRFAGDPDILGRAVQLNRVVVKVIGVTPRDFVGTGVAVPDFWLPIGFEPLVHADDGFLRDREKARYRLFARLAPGVSIPQAQAELTATMGRLRQRHDPKSEAATPVAALVWPGSPFALPLDQYSGLTQAIWLIMAAAGMVLLVACANVGSLQLARARSRQGELHTRLALGASRLRVIRQLLTESALLGLLAGSAALMVTWILLKTALGLAADAFPAEYGTLIFDVTPDLAIFAYVLGISLLAGVMLGLAPALESSRAALASTARTSTSPARSRKLQNGLVAAQVGFSLVLLIAGSLFIRSAIRSLDMNPGYASTQVVALSVQFPEYSRNSPAHKTALTRDVVARAGAMPGVTMVTAAQPPDANQFRTSAQPLDVEAASHTSAQTVVPYSYVQPNYFDALGVPILQGSHFASGQTAAGSVVMLSESAAKQFWPGQNPIGRGLRLGQTDERVRNVIAPEVGGTTYQVIGVVRDTRGVRFDGSDSRQIYLPLTDDQLQSRSILLRTTSDPAALMKAIDPMIASLDPDLVATSSTLDDRLRQSGPFVISSLSAAVASTVGAIGLLLTLMGIQGTVSYIVVLRTREVGIRMAIGAQRRDVIGLILREVTRPVFTGLLAGLVLAVGVSFLLHGLLFGVGAVDPVSFVGVSFLFLVVALSAAYAPSRRALKVNPIIALRHEG